MGAAEKIDQLIPLELYWELESDSNTKHEYMSGRLLAMAGGTVFHSMVGNNIGNALGRKLEKRDCFVLDSDVKVAIYSKKSFFYPDASVVCGEFGFYEDRKDTITNPKLIVEVLSDSTEGFDRGEKFATYRTMDSLEEYVLISQNTARVEVFSKKGDKVWQMRTYEENENDIALESLNITVNLNDIYHKVSFETDS